MSQPSLLVVSYPRSSQLAEQPVAWFEGILGCATFNREPLLNESAITPEVDVRLAVPGIPEGIHEVWRTSQPVVVRQQGAFHYSRSEDLLFGTVCLTESSFETDPADSANSTPLQRATKTVYLDIFHLLDRLGYPYLHRVWNFFPRINEVDHGLERYQQFNIGRQEGFLASGRAIKGSVPAACALGSPEGPLTVYFLAGRVEPVAIENPRQICAYNYPRDYGPRSPTFSRASISRLGEQEILFVSGTASIIGHSTVHNNDVMAQTREALANIDRIVGEANNFSSRKRFNLQALSYKVYVRHPEDVNIVRAEIVRVVGPRARAVYLNADICRQDLIVEIEACSALPNEFL